MTDPTAEGHRLLDFARASADTSTGFLWLDDRGVPDPTRPVHTWVTTRMTHCFALAHLRGEPGAAELASHGVRSLTGPLRDTPYGGWHAAVAPDGRPVDSTKEAYGHAFVVLAATSAVVAGIDEADDLLADALAVVERHFLDDAGRVVDGFDRQLRYAEPYRGANSSMHMVEAFLAAGDVTGDADWHRRALHIAEHLIHGVARTFGYYLPEHYAADWVPLPDYNRDSPADQFRPYGCTPGHLLEWSRLLLDLEASLTEPPGWLLEDARSLFAAAVTSGWHVDGEPGLVYTVDWDQQPVVRSRLHWVHAEAVAAAAALNRRTKEQCYADWQQRFWGFIERFLIDPVGGSWHHELDAHNVPSAQLWEGKPDIYHAYQATLLPTLELAPCASMQLAGRV
ncbi:MAG TPA: AGE family epimerase/isomerase [Nocardioidaceae bacterium]|nr:AGE family epimerase/isomerase [Nocardioidaceae bacterium]